MWPLDFYDERYYNGVWKVQKQLTKGIRMKRVIQLELWQEGTFTKAVLQRVSHERAALLFANMRLVVENATDHAPSKTEVQTPPKQHFLVTRRLVLVSNDSPLSSWQLNYRGCRLNYNDPWRHRQ
jgi:hypothetical protein